jgi:hypothetical protein
MCRPANPAWPSAWTINTLDETLAVGLHQRVYERQRHLIRQEQPLPITSPARFFDEPFVPHPGAGCRIVPTGCVTSQESSFHVSMKGLASDVLDSTGRRHRMSVAVVKHTYPDGII